MRKFDVLLPLYVLAIWFSGMIVGASITIIIVNGESEVTWETIALGVVIIVFSVLTNSLYKDLEKLREEEKKSK